MDDQANGAAQGVGTVEARPSFVHDVIAGAERVGEGIVDDVEHLVGVGGEFAQAAVADATAFAGDPVAAIKSLGLVHFELSHIGLSTDLRDAIGKVEEAIVSLARHIAGVA